MEGNCLVCREKTTKRLQGRFICKDHGAQHRISRFGGVCRFCGGKYSPGEWMVMVKSSDGGEWFVYHPDGHCIGDENPRYKQILMFEEGQQ